MKVAIIGAGAAGSACAWRLTSGSAKGLSVSVFEMGRGAGGRAGTRHVRGYPGLNVSHGAPLFHVPADKSINTLISALLSSGHLKEWSGKHGAIDAATGDLSAFGASRGEPEDVSRYSGVPGMSSLAGGCLELARTGGTLQTHFSTRIKELRPKKSGKAEISGWELFDKDAKHLGDFDWVVIAGATPALARWRAGFKEEPPVLAAAEASGSALLRDLLARLDSPLKYEQTHVAMLAWELSKESSIVETLQSLPFDVAQVTNDDALAKVCVQSMGPQYAVIVLHSTADFARKHKKVMGSESYVSVTNNVAGSVKGESAASMELFVAFERLLQKLGAPALAPPTWGPTLHRWGAAFPEPDLGSLGMDTWFLPNERLAFAGDFLAPPSGCVAAALKSGLAAGDALLRHGDGLPVEVPNLLQKSSL